MCAFFLQLCTVFLLLIVSQCSAQAPGDEDDRCLRSPYVHIYEDDVKILMDSYNYLQLLPGNGTGNPPIASALWNDRSFDGNDIVSTTAATYVRVYTISPHAHIHRSLFVMLMTALCTSSGSKVLEHVNSR